MGLDHSCSLMKDELSSQGPLLNLSGARNCSKGENQATPLCIAANLIGDPQRHRWKRIDVPAPDKFAEIFIHGSERQGLGEMAAAWTRVGPKCDETV